MLEILDGNGVGSCIGEAPGQHRVAVQIDVVVLRDHSARCVEKTDDAVEPRAERAGDDLEDHFLAGASGEPIGIDVAGRAERADQGRRQRNPLRRAGIVGLLLLRFSQRAHREAQLIGHAERCMQPEAMHPVRHLLRDGHDRRQREPARLVVDRRVGADHAFRDDHFLHRHFFNRGDAGRKSGFAEDQAGGVADVGALDGEGDLSPPLSPVGVSFCRVGGAVCAHAGRSASDERDDRRRRGTCDASINSQVPTSSVPIT